MRTGGKRFVKSVKLLKRTTQRLKDTWVRVSHNEQLTVLEAPLLHDCKAVDVLKRP